MTLRTLLLLALGAAAFGCGSGGDTNVPQVERKGAPHPPGVDAAPTRPQ